MQLSLLQKLLQNNRLRLLAATFILVAISSAWMTMLYSPDDSSVTRILRYQHSPGWIPRPCNVGNHMVSLESISCFSQSNTRIVGWGGLAILLFLYNHLNEFQLFLYRGGILLTAIPTALLKIDASSPVTLLSKMLQTRILPRIGSRSYSIYPLSAFPRRTVIGIE